MSRIILTRYDNGDEHIVVGWDRPLQTFFWQEFNREPDPDPESGEVNWDGHDGWEQMLGYSGYMPREYDNIESLLTSAPERVRMVITNPVQVLLLDHKQNEDQRYNDVVDLTKSNVVQG